MHTMIIQPVQICYQVYAGLVVFALAFGVSLMMLAFVTLYGIGGTEVTLTVLCSVTYCLVRSMIPIRTGSGGSYNTQITSKELAIHTFVLGGKENVISECCTCCICLEDYEDDDSISEVRVCGHLFHEKCLDLWVSRNNTSCPYCRQGIGKKCIDGTSDAHKAGAWGIFDGILDSVYG
eukprot:scaffold5395_cov126-Cylindrotheca_fusiformis.AAC.16